MEPTKRTFPQPVVTYWNSQIHGELLLTNRQMSAVQNDSLSANRRVTLLLDQSTGHTVVAAQAQVWAQMDLTALQDEAPIEQVIAKLKDIGIEMHTPDNMFYPPAGSDLELPSLPTGMSVTVLDSDSVDHVAMFDDFERQAPRADLEQAQVALDDWLVVGVVYEGRLVGVASLYPWGDDTFADIGVLTLPGFRGKGVAKTLVQRAHRMVRDRGYVLQYRCQIDNVASRALAESVGLELYAQWSIPTSGEDS